MRGAERSAKDRFHAADCLHRNVRCDGAHVRLNRSCHRFGLLGSARKQHHRAQRPVRRVLLVRKIDRRARRHVEPALLDIGNDADDRTRRGRVLNRAAKRPVVDGDLPANRALPRPELARDRFADDHDRPSGKAVRVAEPASVHERNAERAEIVGADEARVGGRHVRGIGCAVGQQEICAGEKAGRHAIADGRGGNATAGVRHARAGRGKTTPRCDRRARAISLSAHGPRENLARR